MSSSEEEGFVDYSENQWSGDEEEDREEGELDKAAWGDSESADEQNNNNNNLDDVFDEGTDEFANLPADLEFPKGGAGSSKKRKFGAFDVEDGESMSYEASMELPDPDPAFIINEEAIAKFKQNVQDHELITEQKNLRYLLSQQSTKRRLIELDSKDKSLMTPEEKQSVRLIKRKEAGEPIDKLISHDPGNVVTIPCDPPYQSRIDRFLGPAKDWPNCFGCSYGVGYTTIDSNILEHLTNFIVKSWPNGDALIQSVLISHFYEREIRTPHNKSYANHGQPLPEWCPRQVYECLTEHKSANPQLWLIRTLRELSADQSYLQSIKYSFPSSILEQERRATVHDLQINSNHQKEYRETLKLQIALRKLKPKDMFGGINEAFDFSKATGGVITTKSNIFKGPKQLTLGDMTKFTQVKKGV